MGKVYTKKGDSGYTKDYAGRKVAKDSCLIVLGGKIDALQSSIDGAMMYARGKTKKNLENTQKKLWQMAAETSHCDKACLLDPITKEDLEKLERDIDALGKPPKHFIRCSTWKAIMYNEARVRCRDVEREMVPLLRKKKVRPMIYQYVNRLSSYFFMLAYKG